jgi:hypothetical protein
MTQPILSDRIEADLRQEMIGKLVVGHYVLTVGSKQGLWLELDHSQPVIEARKLPVMQLPLAFSRFQGRQEEVDKMIEALPKRQPIVLLGAAGVGKTVLLRHLTHHPHITTVRGDGMLYFSGRQPLADLLQTLFDKFYRTTPPLKPTPINLRLALQDKQILLLLDGCPLAPEDVRQLRTLLPLSQCLIVAPGDRRDHEGTVMQLEGLSLPASTVVVEQELGYRLPPEQVAAMSCLWTLFQGHPQRLRQAAVLAREESTTLAKLLPRLHADNPGRSLTRLLVASLPKTQRWIVALLVAMNGVGLRAEQIAAMTGPPNPQSSLQALLKRHLIQLDGHRYCLAASLVEMLQEDFDPAPWMERALAHLVPWAEQHCRTPERILPERDVLVHTLQWAVHQELWVDVLRVVRSVENTLILKKQWKTAEQLLQWGLQAAWALEDAPVEAWVLHELGTLALCQEDVTAAYDALSQALSLRQALRDEAGIKITQQAVGLLKQVSLPHHRGRLRISNAAGVYLTLGVIVIVVFGLSSLLGWTIFKQWSKTTPDVTPIEQPQ